jgi:hypothetical protein
MKCALIVLALTCAAAGVSGCATYAYPVRERVVVGEWIPGHWVETEHGSRWVPGHYR